MKGFNGGIELIENEGEEGEQEEQEGKEGKCREKRLHTTSFNYCGW